MDTTVTTETYSDPRANEATSDFDDKLQVTRTTTCQYSRTLSTYTEYGTYTRETVQEAFKESLLAIQTETERAREQ
ncbi:hypothetical protein NA56DRAFT_697543 [Hyaloscypha hepaticicola]|uniref:Uncharacterized protein n=1 Tax=Hyaloscypha hepaticicola TaxID=2082293 RepID=A0A2J6QM68_9HELO|nr:hypothetical protein NA56DRAFT_697543 [Hyaloscypha hepaticicola]